MEQFLSDSKILAIFRNWFQTELALTKYRFFLRNSAITENIDVPGFLIVDIVEGFIDHIDFFEVTPLSRFVNTLKMRVASL